ncbi:MAG TPA: GGDEF domain-containing protein [Solirubrobacter sp.]|nr:GGDEF domain-containing protein [Solirubrobacter sp.]
MPDERPLAGRIVGWMYIVGAIVTTLLPVLPGAHGEVVTPTLPIAVAGFVWGVAALCRVDWVRAPGWVIHASAFGGSLCAAVATHDTGGAVSPARFLLMLVVVFAAYFFPAREAWPYLGVVLALHALPFAYDTGALSDGLLGELLIVAPCYWLLAFLLVTGKRGMVELRSHADRLARQDPLTGLANRRALLEAMGDVHARAGLVMLDLDDFKAINTRYGHAGGDRALAAVAECLRRACRAGDLPARLGGDEFAVLVRGADPAGMETLAQRLLAEVRADGRLRVSAGWAVSERGTDTLLLEADQALAAAKRAGKDRALAYA